ncbi:zinc-dependent metalloprotease [Aquabacterium sp. A7-Y]|uniref:zinc-dependent metalloprotease n=1 Tax=Aquabacterium sp. A7-Y TaxID=1349605 RepID=UPI00223D6AC4|nr:zinc-dependent metalloprotease [Aquabacterium sp. A7-Y]MCW7537447.1 zinc-dependent metalloprotease [Aquabacterium sp. A7-Y]
MNEKLMRWPLRVGLLALLSLGGCATMTVPPAPQPGAVHPPAPAETAAATRPVAPSPMRTDNSGLRAFSDVIRGATASEGYFPLWRKDDKVWLEIPESRLNQPFLLSVNVHSSVGERGLYASQMGDSWVASFRRVGNQMQLLARNTAYRAEGNQPLARALAQGFSDSLLGATPVVSAEHSERRSVLVDASFLLGDISGYSSRIESAFRTSYSFDRANSFFEQSWVSADATTLNVRMHFSTPRLPGGGATPPSTTPDARSFFVGFVYNFTRLPETPMRPRLADPRLGHFTDAYTDVSTDLKSNPRVHHINRWRLEKKDPTAALSEPTTPIVYWLDKNIPQRYRASVEAGVLEWNKAFERIGFKNAIVVKQQPDDADWDTLDSRHASIRWYVGADAGFARGPHHSDPRTGEILDADISMADVFSRSARRFIVEEKGHAVASRQEPAAGAAHRHEERHEDCNYALENAAEMDFVMDTLEARGELSPDSPEAEAFVQSVIKDTIMHEVGHTLGLKHNFKASTTVRRSLLGDSRYTREHGVSGSVMDYNAFNLALKGEQQGAYNNNSLGPYDYWAIEYAYKPLAPEQEAGELARIAARSTEPALAYADDYDAGGFAGFEGIDPLANRFDLGDDPLAYAEKRLKLSQELWQRTQSVVPQGEGDPLLQRRLLMSGFRQLNRTTELASKYIGGMVQVRDLPGTTKRRTYTPVDPAKQRQALQLLARGIFSADSFRFRPEFLSSLPPDYLDRDSVGPVSVPNAVLNVQSAALERLLSPGVATRLLDLPHYVGPAAKHVISLQEVYRTLQDAVWSETRRGGEIDRVRRNLQREHLKRVVTLLTRGSASLPADALSLMRLNAAELQQQLRTAAANRRLSVESQAHLQDSLAMLSEALRATMTRG